MKFFLHGGCASIDSPKNKEFFQSFCGHGSKILILPFGGEPEEQIFNDYKQNFIKHNPDNNLLFMCASRDISTLIDQIKNNDILFFPGGKPYKYFELINRIPNFKELCKNKTIAGASGGAIMWAKVYYSSNAENLREGNGFLPIKIIVHRGSDKHPGLSREEREILLDQYGEKLPIYKIPEQEYVEFTI